jgi:POT family proton-dependent oligopeptide transporter
MDLLFVAGAVITVLTGLSVMLELRTHPKGLFILFFAEMWERFSYYGMRGLLIFYLTQHFLFDDRYAQGQYGAYTALVYLVPLIGGIAADKWLGTRKAILFGALLLVAGHFTMGIEGRPAVQTLQAGGQQYEFVSSGRMEGRQSCLKVGQGCYQVGPAADGGLEIKGMPASGPLPQVLAKGSYAFGVAKRDPVTSNFMYLALSLIIMGVGFLKANISSIVGQLYDQDDPRRDPGFTLYYYGINLGAFWSSLICGWLGLKVGWWAGFGLAGVGMLAGFLVFILGKPLLQGKGEPPDPVKLKKKVVGPIDTEWLIYLLGLAGVGVVWLLVQRYETVGFVLGGGSILVLAYLFWFMATKCTPMQRQRLMLAMVLIVGWMIFEILFEQAGSSLNQFAERNTQPHLLGVPVSAPQTQSFNAGFILIFAPVFAWLWTRLGRAGKDPNPVVKFGLALLQVGAGFGVLVWAANFADASWRVPMVFLALAYLLHTTGELCLSPVGLSEMTKLAPMGLLSTLMAIWFLAASWGQYLAAVIARLTAQETVAGQVLDPAAALRNYTHVFGLIGLGGAGAGVVFLALSPWLKKWAHAHEHVAQGPEPSAEAVVPAGRG